MIGVTYNLTAVDTNNEIVPGFDRYFMVLVPQDLKAKRSVAYFGSLHWAFGI